MANRPEGLSHGSPRNSYLFPTDTDFSIAVRGTRPRHALADTLIWVPIQRISLPDATLPTFCRTKSYRKPGRHVGNAHLWLSQIFAMRAFSSNPSGLQLYRRVSDSIFTRGFKNLSPFFPSTESLEI